MDMTSGVDRISPDLGAPQEGGASRTNEDPQKEGVLHAYLMSVCLTAGRDWKTLTMWHHTNED